MTHKRSALAMFKNTEVIRERGMTLVTINEKECE